MKNIHKKKLFYLTLFLALLQTVNVFSLSDAEVSKNAKKWCSAYIGSYMSPQTHMIYNTICNGIPKESIKFASPEEIQAGMVKGKKKPYGYGSGMSDPALFGGQLLYAIVEAYEAKNDPDLKQWARELFSGFKIIGTASPVKGFIPRGPHPDNRKAYYTDSSQDQHLTYIMALGRYYKSSLASKSDKEFIEKSLDDVCARIENNGWTILIEDNSGQAHASGGDWTAFITKSVSKLLPMLYITYKVTKKSHWEKLYNKFSTEENGRRWNFLRYDNKEFQINAHPCYANQDSFRLHAFYTYLDDPEKKNIVKGALQKAAEIQLSRKVPSDHWITKFSKGMSFWKHLSDDFISRHNWPGRQFQDTFAALEFYDPAQYTDGKSKTISRFYFIRVPLTGLTMAYFSGEKKLMKKTLAVTEKNMNTYTTESIKWNGEHFLYSTILFLQYYTYHFTR